MLEWGQLGGRVPVRILDVRILDVRMGTVLMSRFMTFLTIFHITVQTKIELFWIYFDNLEILCW